MSISSLLAPIGILVFGILFFVLILVRPSVSRARMAMWSEVTRRLGGKLFVKEGDLHIRFRWNGLDAVLRERPEPELVIAGGGIASPPLTLSASNDSREILPGYTLAGGLLNGYVAHVQDLAKAREFLSPAVRRILEDLRIEVFDERRAPQIQFQGDFRTSHGSADGSMETLARFVHLSLQLAQHARMFVQVEAGITILGEGSGLGRSECQICGAALEGLVVRCTRCATPHHQDCWEYAGRCSTYGCGERRSSRV